MNPNLTDEEIESLKATKSEHEWNAACDAVKGARNGRYPDDWYARVMISGLAYDIQQTWN